MSTSRRDFVKASFAAGVGIAAGNSVEGQSSDHLHAAHHPAATPAPQLSSEFTRGIGMYPGAGNENFAPALVPASDAYRNLALLRPAYHSSSHDYNLVAQLVTDGIVHDRMPEYVSVSVDGKLLAKPDREIILDHFATTSLELIGARPVVEINLAGGVTAPTIDRMDAFVIVSDQADRKKLLFTAFGSPDGYHWTTLGSAHAPEPLSGENFPPDLVRGNALLTPSVRFAQPQQARFYRLQLEVTDAVPEQFSAKWGLGEVSFYSADRRVEVGGPYSFTSAWKSAGLAEEWVSVDLGTICSFDHVTLHWIAPAAEGRIQVSNDASQWRDVGHIYGASKKEEIGVTPAAHGRYVRVLMTKPATGEGYVLSEVEVFGRGGLRVQAKERPKVDANGRLHLAGGGWKLRRADQVALAGEAVATPDFRCDDWPVATVPGTVLTSYLNAGAVPDPDFGVNQLYISDSYFYSDFWYRTEFDSPSLAGGELHWLEFAGINWKANIFLNGEKLGRIEGAFQRAKYNVTGKLQSKQPNVLAVFIEKNATPGSTKQKTVESPGRNGGALGADNPTFHSSIGWDWISTIRGRNTGIWNSVDLVTTSSVTLADPSVTSVLPLLPDTSRADLTLAATVSNHANAPVSGKVIFRFGELSGQQAIALAGGESKVVTFSPKSYPQLSLGNPRLWWPAGYGEPNLHDAQFRFVTDAGNESAPLAFKAGIRQITASEKGDALRLWVNGRRVVPKGGNWGFSESMLRYRAREYDAALRYHREMNFNMVRNWVGQIGEEAFYEACDRHGILVWQDFWLANPWDGPIPNDNAMFLRNAKDLLLKVRMHPAMCIYCGRNEWFPPKPLDDGLRALISELHPDLHYIGSSADGPVSGHGPYQALSPQTYFRIADTKLHSEIGSPNIPSFESVQLMMPESAQWPLGLDWGIHDFSTKGAQGSESFRSFIDASYGGATNAKEWVELAQFVNYDTYRAMFEAQGKNRMGVLLWMSHSCWPSFVWQTYDYYLEPTSAYFACKNACEPLHIQWNPLSDTVEVINSSGGSRKGLTAKLSILDSRGAVLSTQSSALDSAEDSHTEVFAIRYPAVLPQVHFLRLTLTHNGEIVSKNTYIRGHDVNDYRGLRALPPAKLATETAVDREGEVWKLSTSLRNASPNVAVMVRISAVRAATGDRILPAVSSDNYITLMPGEAETIVTEVKHEDTRGERPRIVVKGFNIA